MSKVVLLAVKQFSNKEVREQLESAKKNKNQSDIKLLEAELKRRKIK